MEDCHPLISHVIFKVIVNLARDLTYLLLKYNLVEAMNSKYFELGGIRIRCVGEGQVIEH